MASPPVLKAARRATVRAPSYRSRDSLGNQGAADLAGRVIHFRRRLRPRIALDDPARPTAGPEAALAFPACRLTA